jgi:hypothetical protein
MHARKRGRAASQAEKTRRGAGSVLAGFDADSHLFNNRKQAGAGDEGA